MSTVPAARTAATGRLSNVLAVLARLARSPVTIVGAIVLASFWLAARDALLIDDWVVMTDELLYVKLAQSIGDSLSPVPHVHGEYIATFGQLFPLLLAPFVALLPMPAVFEAAHALNALLMASTAIPAYLLARSLELPRLAAYLVAALTVAVPWLGMSMIVWTEAAAYPAFLWGILGIHRAVVAPSRRNDLLALGGIGLAFLGRTQFAFLAAVLPLAIVIHEVGYGVRRPSRADLSAALRRAFTGHRTLVVAYAVLALGAILLAARSSLSSALGTYATTSSGDILPAGVLDQAGRHLASMTVGIGVVPLVLGGGWALSTVLRPSRRELHAFAVIALLVVPALFLIAGSFTLRFASGALEDRYVFYAAPLLFAGMVACLLDERRRWLGVVAAGLGFFLVADYVSYEESARTPFFWSPSTSFWYVLDGKAYELGSKLGISNLSPVTAIEVGTLVLTAVLAALIRFRPPGKVLLVAVTVPVLAYGVAVTDYVLPVGVGQTGGGTQFTGGAALEDRDWIDEALPEGGDAAVVPTWVADNQLQAERVWWQAEFWNKRVTRTISANGATTYTPFPVKTMSVDYATGRVHAEEQVPYLVVSDADRRFGLATERVLASGFIYLEAIEPVRPYRAEWTSRGLLDDGWTDEDQDTGLRLHSVPGQSAARRVTLRLAAPADVLSRRPFVISGGKRRVSGVVELGGESTVSTTVCVPAGGSKDLTLDVRDRNKLPDGRVIGLRVMDIDVAEAPPGACRTL